MDIPKLIAAQRAYFETGATRDIAVRRRALQALQASVRRHEEVLCSALRADLGKSVVESYMTEIGIVAGEIRFALRNLKRWMRPRPRPDAALRLAGAKPCALRTAGAWCSSSRRGITRCN